MMPRNEPIKDPVLHSEAQVRGWMRPRDPARESVAMTRHTIAAWNKLIAAGALAPHETPTEETPDAA